MFANKVSELCFRAFNKLDKNGKPKSNEFVLLAAFIQKDDSDNMQVVAMATGSKCLGRNQLDSTGHLLHDSHAEILARRAFKMYLLEQITKAVNSEESIFNVTDSKCTMKNGITFHFYTSHVPCGDAAIIPKINTIEPKPKRQKLNGHCMSPADSLFDIYRTGAKPAPGEIPDPLSSGENYHTKGILRTKPGRGDPTISHSCSDKIFKWAVLGVQGSLLMIFINEPIFIESIIIGPCSFNLTVFMRSIYTRFQYKLHGNFNVVLPVVIQAESVFPLSQFGFEQANVHNVTPSPTSLIWYFGCNKHEVSVDGRKHGVSLKNARMAKSRLSICRISMAEKIINLMKQVGINVESNLSYHELKMMSNTYQNQWTQLRQTVLPNWVAKPKILKEFIVS